MGSAAVTLIIALLTFVISADSLETDPQCPNPSEVLTFYPYPYDCAQYYECYEGNRYLITCPTDLYWNTITGRCDNKTSVDCGTRGSSTVNPATTATTSTGSTASSGTQTVAPTTEAPDPLCPYPSEVLTFYENPSDCSQYYECYEGKKYLITCPTDLYWNTITDRCDNKTSVDCGTRGSSTVNPATTATTSTGSTASPGTQTVAPTTEAPDPLCPYPSDVLTFYENPSDCSQYYECYQGKKYLITCPTDLYWNTITDRCDNKTSVDCGTRGSSTVTPATTAVTPTGSTASPGTQTKPTAWTPDPLCPYPSETLGFYPDPEDCSKYYECYEGNKYLISCPNELYWNTATNMCDVKSDVNCGDRSSTTTVIPTDIPTDTPTTATTPTPTDTTTDGSTAWTPDPLCPYPSETFVFYPYPYNCAQYYQCYEGIKYLITCPTDMYWNDQIQICQAQDGVDCGNRTSTSVLPTSTTSAPTTDSTQITTANTDPTTWAPDPLCPYPSEDLTFFPNPANCSQYFECYEGNKYLITCPTDQYWSDQTQKCDDLQNVNCDRSTTTTTPNTGPTEPGDNRCVGQPDGSFHPNPDDCSKFYQCDEGVAIDEQCPSNTYWNQAILTCDFPNNVNCSNN